MNHQNADEKNTTKSEISLKTDRELATALHSMALATQDPSPIFELNVDCWEEIFDWLSVTDVHAFGQTCKFFHQIAGKYFEWKYRRTLARVFNNEMTITWKDLPGFNEFAQRLSISESEPEISLLYASANCKSPKELKIGGVPKLPSGLELKCLEKMMANVEILRFDFMLDAFDDFLESILILCATTLKRLKIYIQLTEMYNSNWMHYKYPKLQHLALGECNFVPELVQFFEANPNVRSFSTVAEDILKYKSEFMASTIELDDLQVQGETTMEGIPVAFNDLYNRGFYKRCHFRIFTEKHLANLPGVTTLDVGTDDHINLPRLPTVTRLSFRPLWKSERSLLGMNEVTDALPNLEYVVMRQETNMEFIMPFIEKSKKLKEIKTHYIRNDRYFRKDIDPVLMNDEREKLIGAHKVMIYVEERDFLRIKWKYSKSDFGLIEIKRHESYDGVLDHNFDYFWE